MCVYNGITFTSCFLKMRTAISNLRYRNLTEDVVENRAADEAYDTNA